MPQAIPVPRPLPSPADEQCGVFSTAQAIAEGWTSHALRHAVDRGRIHRLRTGAYRAADLTDLRPDLTSFERARWQHAAPAIAAALTTPGAAASHSAAAV